MTPPPRKYAEAPGMASSAAEISPPADDSATAIVSLRCLSSVATGMASEVSSVVTAASLSPDAGDSMALGETDMATTLATRYLTEAQIASYHRDGYLAVPSLLDGETVSALRRVTDAFVGRARAVTRSDAIFDLDPRHTAAR